MVNYVIQNDHEGHLQLLILIEWSFEILVFDVCTTKFGSWGTDDCRDHVGCKCGEFVWIINEVATNSDSNSIWVVFWGAVEWLMIICAYVTV